MNRTRRHTSACWLGWPLLTIAAAVVLLPSSAHADSPISLAGQWRLALDREDAGLRDQWFRRDLATPDTIRLPGILQAQGYGDLIGIHTPWENVHCCGDWVRHTSPSFFLERAVVTGIEAANAVLQTRHLPAWKLLDYAPPERFAGFIEKLMRRGRRRRRERLLSGKR